MAKTTSPLPTNPTTTRQPEPVEPKPVSLTYKVVRAQVDEVVGKVEVRHHQARDGAANQVGHWALDKISKRGVDADAAVEKLKGIAEEARRDGFIAPSEQQAIAAQAVEAGKRLEAYESLENVAAVGVGLAAMVAAPVIVGVTGAAAVGTVGTVLIGSVANVAAKALIKGSNYSLSEAAVDTATGAIGGGAGVVAAKHVGVALASRTMTAVASNAVVGAGSGAAASAAAVAVDPINWDQGVGPGVTRVAQGAVFGAAAGTLLGVAAGKFAPGIKARAPESTAAPAAPAASTMSTEPSLLGAGGKAVRKLRVQDNVLVGSLLPRPDAPLEGAGLAAVKASEALKAQIEEGFQGTLSLLGRSNSSMVGGDLKRAGDKLTALWGKHSAEFLNEGALREHAHLTLQQYSSKILLELVMRGEAEYQSALPSATRAMLTAIDESPRLQEVFLKAANGSKAVAGAIKSTLKFAFVFGVGLGLINTAVGAFTGPLNDYTSLVVNDNLRPFISWWRKIWSPAFLNANNMKHLGSQLADSLSSWFGTAEGEAAIAGTAAVAGTAAPTEAPKSKEFAPTESLQSMLSPVLVDMISSNNAYTWAQQGGRELQVKRDANVALIGMRRANAEMALDQHAGELAKKLATWTPPPDPRLIEEYKQTFRLWSVSDPSRGGNDVARKSYGDRFLAIQQQFKESGASEEQIRDANQTIKLIWEAEATAGSQMWAWVRFDAMFADTAADAPSEEARQMYLRTTRDGNGFYPALRRHFGTMKLLAQGIPRLEEILRRLEPLTNLPTEPTL